MAREKLKIKLVLTTEQADELEDFLYRNVTPNQLACGSYLLDMLREARRVAREERRPAAEGVTHEQLLLIAHVAAQLRHEHTGLRYRDAVALACETAPWHAERRNEEFRLPDALALTHWVERALHFYTEWMLGPKETA